MDNEIKYKERIVVMGFGAQGSAQAMNLKDSGRELSVFLRRESPRNIEAREAGLLVVNDPREASAEADVAALLLPDGEQPGFYREFLEPGLPEGALLVFAHGFAVHYGEIRLRKDLDAVLAAPMAQGAKVRSEFASGRGVPVLLAVAQDATGRALERAKAYARGISRTGPFIETTVREEVESDLFAEQAVLCGGMPSLVRAAFDTLVAGGTDPRIAYLCCLRELGAIVSVMERHGISGLFSRISDTARYGAITRGPALVDSGVRERMSVILEDILSGRFAEELKEEAARGYPKTKALLAESAAHPIERIHEEMTKA